jgi:hypothetical protein
MHAAESEQIADSVLIAAKTKTPTNRTQVAFSGFAAD